jgi:sugar-specific transcriptional regulator TrmB
MTAADPIAALGELGFSLNEARAYVALLEGGTQTGYEVGQRAQVPRSAVYGVLRKLVEAGAARSIAGQPERFSAAPPDAVVSQLKKRFEVRSRDLDRALRSVERRTDVPEVFAVRGYDAALSEASRLIREATATLVLSGWPRELAELAGDLAAAHQRGVAIVVFSHAALPDGLAGTHFSYGLSEPELEAFWRHRLIVVADDRATLIAATEQDQGDRAVVSQTPAIAEVATSQVALDVTLLAQREGLDAGPALAKVLGERIGNLDGLLAARDASRPKKRASTGE